MWANKPTGQVQREYSLHVVVKLTNNVTLQPGLSPSTTACTCM